ncbi:MAG: hypothetical protein JXP34_15265 [Planctomycetes bacterium]|nr:hypothetical protein [Planctomycetota bacterium]
MRRSAVGAIRWIAVVAAVAGARGPAIADSWPNATPKRFASASGQYVFRTTPLSGFGEQARRPGRCEGALFRVDDGKEVPVWRRPLINNVSPVTAMVADEGPFVVTFDEWGGIGRLPVVIYDPQGNLVDVYNLRGLGLDWRKDPIEVSASSIHWNRDALIFFGPEDTLIIRLHWGRVIRIGLRTGRVLETPRDIPVSGGTARQAVWDALDAAIEKRIREIPLEKLRTGEVGEIWTGIRVARDLAIREAIPILRDIAAGRAPITRGGKPAPEAAVEQVREKAREALARIEKARS